MRIITFIALFPTCLSYLFSTKVRSYTTAKSIVLTTYKRVGLEQGEKHSKIKSFYELKYNSLNILQSTTSSTVIDTADSQQSEVYKVTALFRRLSWVSWWIQFTLTVISSVILTFANSTRQSGNVYSLWTSGFAFSSIGVFISLLNSLWTWNSTLLTKRIFSKKVEQKSVFPTLRKYSRISVWLSLIGMFITLLGAEQIVGTLVSKILASPGTFPMLSVYAGGSLNPSAGLQALDIFLVQANTNSLVAHFAALVCYLFLQTQVPYTSITTTAPTTPTNSN
eukprot:gene11248-15092_t